MEFALKPIREVEQGRIADFARRTWGEHDAQHILSKWWLTSTHAEANAAIDDATGQIAGMVVAVPSHWHLPAGTTAPTMSICGWYVAPDYAGHGIGKLLVRSIDARTPCQNTLAITQSAIQSFLKLGWQGPFRTQLLLSPLPGLRRAPGNAGGFSCQSFAVRGAALPADLAAMINQIDAERPAGQLRRRRNAADWQAHLGVRPNRLQHFHVLQRENQPIGAFVIRGTDTEAGPLYRRARLHYVTDIVLNQTGEDVLRFLTRNLAPAAPRTAGALLVCTSSETVAAALRAAGWLSEQSAWIGPRLANKAPLFMVKGPLADTAGQDILMGFTDSDVDFNI